MHLLAIKRRDTHEMRIMPTEILQNFVGVLHMFDRVIGIHGFLCTGDISNTGCLRYEADFPEIFDFVRILNELLFDCW